MKQMLEHRQTAAKWVHVFFTTSAPFAPTEQRYRAEKTQANRLFDVLSELTSYCQPVGDITDV